jgi:hypothetical protein
MNRSWIDPRIKQVTVSNVRDYTLAHGWRLRDYPRPDLLVFETVEQVDGELLLITLPSSERMIDYRMHLEDLIGVLGEYERRWASDVLSDILAAPTANGVAPEQKTDAAASTGSAP